MLKFSVLIGLLCSNLCSSSTPTIGSECDAKSPPVVPNSFQKLMTKMMDLSGQSCEAANAFSKIEDKLCAGVLSRMPKFAFNLKNPNSDMFCQFLDLLPIGKVAGRRTCNAIVDCAVKIIKGKHGDLEKECGTDILKGVVKDIEKKMSDWTNTLSGIASLANDAATSFMETVGCGKDPTSGMTESITAIGKIFKGLTDFPSRMERMFEIIPEIMGLSPEQFYNSLGTDDDKEKDYFSFLLGPGISLTIGAIEISKNLGVFVTVPLEDLQRCAISYVTKSNMLDCVKKMDIYEIGIYEAIGTGVTTDVGAEVGVSTGMEFLHGTSNKWGGYGFGITIGGGPDIFIAEAGGSFGLVFSALESGGTVYVDEFIGFNVYINVGVGPDNPIPVTASVSCALAKVSTPEKCKKSKPEKCPNQNLKQMINRLKETGEQMGQDWVDLYETCKANWGKKWKKCEDAADNSADASKGCGKGFTRKCASFKSNYCQKGKWKEATKTCKKYHEKKGKCKKWNTRKYCSNYGQKKGSCKAWNTRRYCSNYGQKKGSCRNWNTRRYCSNYGQKRGSCRYYNTRRYCSNYGQKRGSCRYYNTRKYCSNYGQKRGSCRSWNQRRYCGQHGTKNKCDRVRKGTSWARIPYICGIKMCKRGWFRYPCGKRICYKNLARAIMGWSCKIVTDASRCLRHVVRNISCRTWNTVRDYSRCLKHVYQRTSCRTWNTVRDYSRCLKHVYQRTSCRTWNTVRDYSRCLKHVYQRTSCRTYNMVKDTANCLKHVAERTSCRTWNMVQDTANCLKHVVENTSCRSWNMVQDTANCLKHVVENTSCQTWHMVKDTAKCVGGWIVTAGKCTVDTVGHCSEWAGKCTKNQLMSNLDLFENCGVNMIPFVPA